MANRARSHAPALAGTVLFFALSSAGCDDRAPATGPSAEERAAAAAADSAERLRQLSQWGRLGEHRLLPFFDGPGRITVHVDGVATEYQAVVHDVATIPDTGSFGGLLRGGRRLLAWRAGAGEESEFTLSTGSLPDGYLQPTLYAPDEAPRPPLITFYSGRDEPSRRFWVDRGARAGIAASTDSRPCSAALAMARPYAGDMRVDCARGTYAVDLEAVVSQDAPVAPDAPAARTVRITGALVPGVRFVTHCDPTSQWAANAGCGWRPGTFPAR